MAEGSGRFLWTPLGAGMKIGDWMMLESMME